jgi:hypothetical protein
MLTRGSSEKGVCRKAIRVVNFILAIDEKLTKRIIANTKVYLGQIFKTDSSDQPYSAQRTPVRQTEDLEANRFGSLID